MSFMYQGFMLNKELKKSRFIPSVENDHEHCTMCGAKFSANHDDIQEGYVTGGSLLLDMCRLCY